MKSSSVAKRLKDAPKDDKPGRDFIDNCPASKLRTMLEKRTTNKSAEDVKSQTTMEDMVNLLYESNCLTKQLEEQTLFYQDSLAGLRMRTEQVISENEVLYEQLKQSSSSSRNNASIKFGRSEERTYLNKLENELDEVKRLNQEKTNRLESIIKSTRKELDVYRDRVSKLQSQLRAVDTESEQGHENICMKCAGVSYFSSQPSQAQLATLHKLTRERGELAEMLAKHKSLLTQCQQREFEAYMEVKKSAESAENVKLEKAEAIIKIKQMESSLEDERKRHDSLVSATNQKWKLECDNLKEKFEKEKQVVLAKIQVLTQKCDENEHQLDKVTREKVNLISDLEKSKVELSASRTDVEKVKQAWKEEVMSIARERAKTQQEVENIQNVYARQVREHEQVKISLTTESEALRQRLAEAQNGWLGAREESLRREEKLKQLENEFYLTNLGKANLESAREENREYFKKQEEQREQQFLETLQETEQKHVELRQELEEMLHAQMKMSSALKDENKRLVSKLEDKKGNHRLEKTRLREELSELMRELETTRKQHDERTSEKENLSQVNNDLAGKVKFLKRENKKALKMIYSLLTKQKELMRDRQTLCHGLEALQPSQIAGTSLQRYHVSQDTRNALTSEQESDGNTSCNVKASNVDVKNEDESL